eukprot:12065648-Heterocapsa_arctica.AAC.1
MHVVASQLATNFQSQFGGSISGGTGRRGEAFQGKGRPLQALVHPRKGMNPEDWPCVCGYINWGKRPFCN